MSKPKTDDHQPCNKTHCRICFPASDVEKVVGRLNDLFHIYPVTFDDIPDAAQHIIDNPEYKAVKDAILGGSLLGDCEKCDTVAKGYIKVLDEQLVKHRKQLAARGAEYRDACAAVDQHEVSIASLMRVRDEKCIKIASLEALLDRFVTIAEGKCDVTPCPQCELLDDIKAERAKP